MKREHYIIRSLHLHCCRIRLRFYSREGNTEKKKNEPTTAFAPRRLCNSLPPSLRLDILVRRIRSYGRCIDAGISCIPLGGFGGSRSIQTRTAVGLMIGASSDQVSDNGILIVDSSGGMLPQSWAKFAGKLANAYDLPEFIEKLDHFVVMGNIWLEGAPGGVVLLGRDTRPSGRTLLQAAQQGLTSFMGTTASDVGVVTTPQLQGMLRAKNQGQ